MPLTALRPESPRTQAQPQDASEGCTPRAAATLEVMDLLAVGVLGLLAIAALAYLLGL